MLYMHATTPRTVDAPAFELQVDAPTGDREIAHTQQLLVVTSPAAVTAVRTDRGFFRLVSWITRAYRSPKTPRILDEAVKPGSANSDRIVLGFFMRFASAKNETDFIHPGSADYARKNNTLRSAPLRVDPHESA